LRQGVAFDCTVAANDIMGTIAIGAITEASHPKVLMASLNAMTDELEVLKRG
jgi:hypothetical protein